MSIIRSKQVDVSSDFDFKNHKLINLSTPLNDYDASTKIYVDQHSIKNGGTITGDVILLGDLYVSGITTTIDVGNLNIRDNIVILNSGETSDHVTLTYSGLEVNRGTGTNYRMVFNDDVDTFQIGFIGNLQSVTTREDNPSSSGLTYWNNTLNRLDTSTNILYKNNGLFLSNNMYISGSTNFLILSKNSATGIKIDTDNPTFGWKDLIGNVTVKGTGSQNPTWTVYRSPIYQYQFTVNDEIWNEFHIPHDYVMGTDLYVHAHWSHISASVTSGSVIWGFDITYSKGHNQSAFSTPFQITVSQSASTTQYQHMIAEVMFTSGTPDSIHLDRNLIEPDGVILIRTILTSNTINGTPEPFLHYVDIHYQSTQLATKNKSPNFYI